MSSNDLVAASVVLLALGLLVCVVAYLRQKSIIDGELSRKTVHMGMGCLCVTFPWIFDRSWPVGILALIACGTILVIGWVPNLRGALRDIDRDSQGELYFPIAIAFAFHYSEGNAVLYCPPVLMLTFGDALAALLGKRFGVSFFTTHEGQKSWEGSTIFLIASFITTFLCLVALSDYSVSKLFLVALLLGVVGFMIEGIAWRGLDNLFIPVFGLFAMEAFHWLSVADLSIRLVVLLAFLGFCFAWKRQSTMNDSALLGSALVLYLVWALMGWQWALAPILVFLLFTRIVPVQVDRFQNYQSITALIAINVVPLFWLAQTMRADDVFALFWPYTLSLAIHLAVIWSKRAKTQSRDKALRFASLAFPVVSVFAIQGVPLLALGWSGLATWNVWALFGSVILCGLACGLSVYVSKFDSRPQLTFEEWTFRNVLSFGGSFAVLALV